jgi:hypothetical protein
VFFCNGKKHERIGRRSRVQLQQIGKSSAHFELA